LNKSEFIETYLHTPYSECNCYELIQQYYKHVFDIALPDQLVVFTQYELIDGIIAREKVNWQRLEEPECGCVLTFREHPKYTNHVAIYLNAGRFLHSDLNKGVTIDCLNDTHYKGRLTGAYKYKA
jgi:cell wall-associated NlpC family hydrolase